MLRTYFIETHGCQMNEHDSEKIGSLLMNRGLSPADSPEQADLFILNTCSVREKAVQKVYSRLGELRKRKTVDNGLIIGVAGCVAQQEGERLVKRAPHVDLVVGTHLYHSIPDLLDEIETSRRLDTPSFHAVDTRFLDSAAPSEIALLGRANSFRASVTIMEGCNKHCAFCVVPHTRGPERNRPSSRILEEVRALAEAGYVEVTLLGQTVNSYRDPERRGFGFGDLLADAAAVPGIRRIRFTSPHPRHFTDDVIAVIAGHSSICPQVHLPLQSGSSRILKKMRRQHDRDWYIDLLVKFQSCGRPIALSTDIIVGFPGETPSDFEETLSLITLARFEQMFSFKYSVRPSTEASAWDDDVLEEEKSRRLQELQELQRRIQIEVHRERYLGREFEILTEGLARDSQKKFGRTESNKIVNFFGAEEPGDFTTVRISGAGPNSLVGETVVDCRIAP